MLTDDQLDALSAPIVELYRAFEDRVIVDIARRIAKMPASPDAAWQVQRLSEAGALYDDIIRRLSVLTGKSQAELRRTFYRAGVRALRFDDRIYRAAGLKPLPLNLSPNMAAILAAGLRKTQGQLTNLTLSTAIAGQEVYLRASNMAYMQVITGTADYNTAISEAVRNVSNTGLTSIQFPRRVDQLDVAIRRAVLTGVNQTVGELQIERASQLGADLVQTTAHIGARNTGTGPANHESWQGRVFSRSGRNPKYPPFVETTGYGTGEGLMGWNCRHNFYPFFEDLSPEVYGRREREEYAAKRYTVDGQQIDAYEASQQQRAIERKIRFWARRANALEAAGADAAGAEARLGYWKGLMRSFLAQTKMVRQPERERVDY